jgi:hypothetical protein
VGYLCTNILEGRISFRSKLLVISYVRKGYVIGAKLARARVQMFDGPSLSFPLYNPSGAARLAAPRPAYHGKASGERAASAALHVLRLTFSRGKAAEYTIDARST